ncbi:fatty acid desaturase [Roseinatronobacter bogoriensis]|uniref:Fatty acid desaturase n=1 Tax=Roseinatronobacter bogoriensis subsp. barguzinensis TaxID=441209 RepID=A0A2K8K7S5_9RHOB|nr:MULTISPECIES: fatty acid desaturase [Rhodobaca]ATX64976.1 fatty acid desaturase [Rhodobaca barguzinensis]MBB4208796.1 omega-6 fatty acid desaturase (delta-12 desaturase) [Rhodobaca bogoriensis DSM 18756]TDW37936.1 omega-6 fatty acid desaturase (delta-12 desaturase) [Rhodobaca barguzinensis]TDY69894.1 omega-6 fatty acid desaturase (delta-12 desaturase) [Rhodobaca bogoriensis DSM 18756]
MNNEVLPPRTARSWLSTLARYRDPTTFRSVFELAATLVPFFALWALAWMALSISPWLALVLAVMNGAFLVRIFIIQHDCGHGSFLKNRTAQDWVGRALGVLTLTPYAVWRRTHAIHHAHHGDLDHRGIGDVTTLTVEEYRARSPFGRFMYRLYRHPLVLFVLGPSYLFILQNRLPVGLMNAGWRYWTSAMGTNAMIGIALALIIWFGGLLPVLLVFLPTSVIAATIGVWLFYVQHQFEQTHWSKGEEWQLHDAALEGSSHYVLPQPLRWLSGNIGIHHVHHLYSRIPFYRLPEVIRDFPELAEAQRLTIVESLSTVKLHLWDEVQGKLISCADAHRQYGIA